MKKPTMTRERWVAGTNLLILLLSNDLAVAKAIKDGRYIDLHAAALLASRGVSPKVDMTDPSQYKALRQAITLFFLKGYRCLNIAKLEALSQKN